MMDTFRGRLRAAAEGGVLLGVKWAIVFVCLGMTLMWLAGDYAVVKQRAYNGQLAFERLSQGPVSGTRP